MSFLPSRDFVLEVAKGNISGHRIFQASGFKIGAANEEDVLRWVELSDTPSAPSSDTIAVFPADAGEQMTIISTSTSDDTGQTGTINVLMDYLDGSGDEQTETITMNGTTGVDSTATDIRFVQSLRTATKGSATGTIPVGDIRITEKADTADVYSAMFAGEWGSMMPIRMVPNNKRLIIRGWSVSGGHEVVASGLLQGFGVRVTLFIDMTYANPPARNAQIFLAHAETFAVAGSSVYEPLAITVPELCIIKAKVFSEAKSIDVGVHWWGVLVDD